MGTHWNRLTEAVPTSTHNLCFEEKYEKCQNFLSENFHFLVVKLSIYLNRRVFVMTVAITNVQTKKDYSRRTASFGTISRNNYSGWGGVGL